MRSFVYLKLETVISTLQALVVDKLHEYVPYVQNECHPFTLNHYLSENVKKLRNQPLLELVRSDVPLKVTEAFMQRTSEQSLDEFQADEMRIALTAYGKVAAAKRVIDNAPILVENNE